MEVLCDTITKNLLYIYLCMEQYILCDHPVYSECTLFTINDKGLTVIQQRYNSETKETWWSEIDPWLTDELYLHSRFMEFFEQRSGLCKDGLYPTVTIRQIMWGLKMKPIPRER